MLFPSGLSINSKTREYRTNKINALFSQIVDFKRDLDQKEKDPSVKITDESSL